MRQFLKVGDLGNNEQSGCIRPAAPARSAGDSRDGKVRGARLKAGEKTTYPLGKNRRAYLVPATGKVEVNGVVL